MAELKPCPFCGGEAHLDFAHGGNKSYIGANGFAKATPMLYRVFCEDCIAQTCPYEEPKDAIEAWNRRIDKEGGSEK